MKDHGPEAMRPPLEEALSAADRQLGLLWSKLAGIEGKDEKCVRLLFTSPEHGSGTTTVACCAALGLARNLEDKVALIETNIYTPGMATYLGMAQSPGLTDCLDGDVEPSEAIRNSQVDGLYVTSAGTPRRPHPGELVRSSAQDLFREVVKDRRYVIIDAPPIIDRPDTSMQMDFADYVVLVLRARSTKRRLARRAMKAILATGAPVLGAIVNRFQSDLPFGKGAEDWS